MKYGDPDRRETMTDEHTNLIFSIHGVPEGRYRGDLLASARAAIQFATNSICHDTEQDTGDAYYKREAELAALKITRILLDGAIVAAEAASSSARLALDRRQRGEK